MTERQRIILNMAATYGRSLYAMAIGLMCGRWALLALGKSDFGLVGLIGGLTAFVAFLNNILAAAIGRFYAVKVGEAKKANNADQGLEECRKWFNTAFSIHSVLPLALVALGYPVGLWMIDHFLNIPADRMDACVVVWRFTCVTCFAGMFNVPFQAMYKAKQEIAELTLYSVVSTTLNAIFLYYMIKHPGFWLVKYAGWQCFIGVAPQLVIAVRAATAFPECKFVREYLFDRERYRQLAKFVVAQFWSRFTTVVSDQGLSILVNKYMGAAYNASMSVSLHVTAHASTLSSSMDSAFWPAITNKTGEDDRAGVQKLCFMSMRISTLLVLLFAIPLALEIREVLRLWLVTPPDFTAELCSILLVRTVLERMSVPYAIAIYGYGKGVMRYSWTVGWVGIGTLSIAWACFALGFQMWSIFIGLASTKLLTVGIRLYMGHTLINFSFWHWLKTVCIPICALVLLTACCGLAVRAFFEPSFQRIVATASVCELVMLPACWFVVLNDSERDFCRKKLASFMRRK